MRRQYTPINVCVFLCLMLCTAIFTSEKSFAQCPTQTDLTVTFVSKNSSSVLGGSLTNFTIVVTNNSPFNANGVTVDISSFNSSNFIPSGVTSSGPLNIPANGGTANFAFTGTFIPIAGTSIEQVLVNIPLCFNSFYPINITYLSHQLCGGQPGVSEVCTNIQSNCTSLTATVVPQPGSPGLGGIFNWTLRRLSSNNTVLFTDNITTTVPVLTFKYADYPIDVTMGEKYNIVLGNNVALSGSFIPAKFTATANASPNPICAGQQVNLTATTNVPSNTLNWTANSGPNPGAGTNINVAPTITTVYTVTSSDATGVCATDDVTVTVNPVPAAPVVNPSPVCPNTPATLSVSNTQSLPGEVYNWYDASMTLLQTSTSPFYTTLALTSTTDFFVEASAAGCTSPLTPVTATVLPSCCPISADLTVTFVFNNDNSVPGGKLTTFAIVVTNNSNFDAIGVTVDISAFNPANYSPGTTFSGPKDIPKNGGTASFSFTGKFIPLAGTSTEQVLVTVPSCFSSSYPVDIIYLSTQSCGGTPPGNPPTLPYALCMNIQSNCTSLTATIVPQPGLPTPGGGIWTLRRLSSSNAVLFTDYFTTTVPVLTFKYADYPIDVTMGEKYNIELGNNVALSGSFVPAPFNVTASAAPNTPICAGQQVNLTATTTNVPGNTLTWTANPGPNPNPGSGTNIIVTPSVTTVYTFTSSDATGVCATDDVTVAVNPLPTAPTALPVNVCPGTPAKITVNEVFGETYNWYDNAGNFLASGTFYNAGILTSNTDFFVESVSAQACTSATKTKVTVTIQPCCPTSVADFTVTYVPSSVYAGVVMYYTINVKNNLGYDVSGVSVDLLFPTTIFTPIGSTVSGPQLIPAGGAADFVFEGTFFSNIIPSTYYPPVKVEVANCGYNETYIDDVTIVFGCPYAWSNIVTQSANYPNQGTTTLSGHNFVFDITAVEFNIAYDPAIAQPEPLANPFILLNAPVGTYISNIVNDGNGHLAGIVNYPVKVDILGNNGDSDPVVYDVVHVGFKVLNKPANSCASYLTTTGVKLHTYAGTIISKPADYGRILFTGDPACPPVDASFTVTPNPVIQGQTVIFSSTVYQTGFHNWFVGERNDMLLASILPTVTYIYNTPGTYTITHLIDDNGISGMATQQITVCGITTGEVQPNSSLCAGNAVSIPFTASACAGYTTGNVFTAQLSDANGSFANAVNIGTLTGTTSGTIQGIIPAGTATGTGYRVRVVSSSPAMNGTSNAGYTLSVADNCNTLSFNGLILDGSDDQVTIPHHSSYDIGGGDFTIETWVKLGSDNNGKPLVSNRLIKQNPGKGSSNGNGKGNQKINIDGFSLSSYTDHLVFQANGMDYSSSTFANILDNNCHHIAVSRSAGILSFYVDGQMQGTANGGKSITSSGTLYIGHDEIDASFAKGQFNEVRLWNTARTATQISANDPSLTGAETGLIAYWRFNESSGQPVFDLSATLNDGYLGTSSSQVDAADPLRSTNLCYPTANPPSFRMASASDKSGLSNVGIYPNPFMHGTNIYLSAEEDKTVSVKITSMSGVSFFEGDLGTNKENYLGDEFPVGMYLLHIKTAEGQATQKLIKIQ